MTRYIRPESRNVPEEGEYRCEICDLIDEDEVKERTFSEGGRIDFKLWLCEDCAERRLEEYEGEDDA